MTTELKPGVALLAEGLIRTEPENRLHRSADLTLGDRKATLTFGPPRDTDGTTHAFAIGGQTAVLVLPQSALDWLLHPLPCPQDAMQRGMLMELACLDLLTALEADLDAPVRPVSQAAPPVALGVQVATDDDALHFALNLSEGLADALADYLDSHAPPPPPPDAAAVSVPVTLRLGQQFLTAEEIATLSAGDVVMLEPGPALLLAKGYAAAVGLEPSGPVVLSELLPLPAPQDRAESHIAFDAARFEMTLAALNDLGPGEPLGLAVFADAAADLLIDGRIAGRAQPVTIGTGAGIRILHLSDATKTP